MSQFTLFMCLLLAFIFACMLMILFRMCHDLYVGRSPRARRDVRCDSIQRPPSGRGITDQLYLAEEHDDIEQLQVPRTSICKSVDALQSKTDASSFH
jgi:hypothetical protein